MKNNVKYFDEKHLEVIQKYVLLKQKKVFDPVSALEDILEQEFLKDLGELILPKVTTPSATILDKIDPVQPIK